MPYSTRSCAVTDFYTQIICHVIRREYCNNMVSDDVDTSSKVKCFDSKVDTKQLDSALCMGKVRQYYNVVSTVLLSLYNDIFN